jgi:tRNA A-37 threonylcarbamoyl transferase component Bud32
MATQRLDEGTLLGGRYRIRAIVGRGGMGSVYKAEDTRLDKMVAVKEMLERADTDDEQASAVRQFEREAKLLAQLSHPNLPKVTDYFVDQDKWYLIMEFVEGRTLEQVVQEAGGPLPLLEVLDWGVQLSDVLAYLHGQDPPIVFRDMKPANIMLQSDGIVKLIDFGIARRFQEGAAKDTLLYGSPGYSPPEQYGRRQTDARSDIYSLGATLHHLITGHDPSPTPFKFALASTYVPGIPPELDIFLQRCTEMDGDKRWSSAQMALETLVSIRAKLAAGAQASAPKVTGDPAVKISGPKVPPTPRPSVRPGPPKAAVTGLGIVAVSLLVLGGWMMSRGRPTIKLVKQPAATPKSVTAIPGSSAGGNASAGASIQVSSNVQGARLLVDGKELGTAPGIVPNAAPGDHLVMLVPSEDSGLASAAQFVRVAGRPVVVNLGLMSRGQATGTPQAGAQINRMFGKHGFVTPSGSSEAPVRGALIKGSVRITGAAKKPVLIAFYFYGSDLETPLTPRSPDSPYKNEEGKLCLVLGLTPETDVIDLPGLEAFLPENAFPVPMNQAGYRVSVFVDGVPVYQSNVEMLAGG